MCPNTTDPTCHQRALYEIWFGEDRHSGVSVNYANSIVNRLTKLLEYLHARYPDERWGMFLKPDGSIAWNRVVLAGHSQGGGHAAFGSKYVAVDRVLMFSWTDWMASAGTTADWVAMPGPTAAGRYFGFIHGDDVPIYNCIPVTWTNLGMFDAGALTTVEDVPPPYDYSHTLQTRYPVPPRQLPHNAIIVDWSTPVDTATLQPVYLPVWEYLLANTPLDSSPTVTVQVSPGTFSAPATIPISASAMDAEGSVTSVDFYCGTTLLGTDTVSPYTCVWTEVGTGVYRLFARATDNAGLFADSMPVTVSVGDGSRALSPGTAVVYGGAHGYLRSSHRESAMITFRPALSGNVSVAVYTVRGDLVWAHRVDVSAGGSPYAVVWFPGDGEQPIAAGIYLVRVGGGGIDLRTKIAVLR